MDAEASWVGGVGEFRLGEDLGAGRGVPPPCGAQAAEDRAVVEAAVGQQVVQVGRLCRFGPVGGPGGRCRCVSSRGCVRFEDTGGVPDPRDVVGARLGA